ncbi:hypothetical protein P8452_54376 [Trifolium repens]|nr:hypothetical protein P8452_54376 [Trifolium repens]
MEVPDGNGEQIVDENEEDTLNEIAGNDSCSVDLEAINVVTHLLIQCGPFSSYSSLSLTLSFSSLSSSFLFHQNRREVEEHCGLISVERFWLWFCDFRRRKISSATTARGYFLYIKPQATSRGGRALWISVEIKRLLAEGAAAAAPPSLLCDRNHLTPGGAITSTNSDLLFSQSFLFNFGSCDQVSSLLIG